MSVVPRVAALYDIHGNLPALDAAIAAADASGAVIILVGGDVVLGPMPRETLDRLLALGSRALFIRGNCDRLVVDAYDGATLTHLPTAVREPILWTAAQLDELHRDFLDALPITRALETEALGTVIFCHATPRSDEEIFTPRTPERRIVSMFSDVAQATIVCGHTHVQFDVTLERWRMINAGSVGMPCGAPGAHWLLLGERVKLVQTAYELQDAARLIASSGYPGAAEFAERHVLARPTVEAMLALLEPPEGQ